MPESMPPGQPNELPATGERQVDALGRYKILGELGRGGCGVVYRALDPSIGRIVAIKTILARTEAPSGSESRERFRREARSAGILSHPNIVTVHDFSDTGDPMFIAMEFVEGKTLGEFISSGPVELAFALRVVRSAADALDYAHSHHIVHRDVKPANFLIVKETGRLKITDFGIAKILGSEESLTSTGMVVGTAQYMSPEQISEAPVTGRSDQFSLAVIAYEMLAGIRPFQGNTWASVIHAIIMANPPDITQYNKDLSPAVDGVLRKALTKDPESRYATCLEFCEALEHAILGATIQRTAMLPTPSEQRKPPTAQQPAARSPSRDAGQANEPTQNMVRPGLDATSPDAAFAPQSQLLKPILIGAIAGTLVAVGLWLGIRSRAEHREAPAGVATQSGSQPASSAPSQVAPAQAAAPVPVKKEEAPPARSFTEKIATRAATPPATASGQSAPPPQPASSAHITTTPSQIVQAPPTQPQTPPIQTAPQQAATPVQPPPAVVPAAPPTAPPKVDDQAKRAEEEQAKRAQDEQAQRQVAEQARKAAGDQTRLLAEEQSKAAHAALVESVSKALRDYQSAYQRKDSNALRAIWPSIPKQLLEEIRNSFREASEVRMNLQPSGDPQISGATATVICDRSLHQVIMKQPLDASGKVRIVLRQAGAGWVIQSVDPIKQ